MTPNKSGGGIFVRVISALMIVFCAGIFCLPATEARTNITLSGPQQLGPIEPDSNGSFNFLNVPLRENSVNVFTITATDDFGNKVTREVRLTQLSLKSIVVSKVVAVPIPPEQVQQLVNDGIIKLDNPENFNVSKFDIVLTIGKEEVPISVHIAMPKAEEKMGYEIYSLPKDDGSGGGKPRSEEIQVLIFDLPVFSTPEAKPLRIPGVIIIEGRIKTLKEFFSVRFLLMNTSGIFTLKDVKVQLEFPNGGLSNTMPADGIASLGNILPGSGDQPGQVEREFIIRGDEIGVRPVKVNFGGFVAGPGISEDAPIPFNGSAETSVEVKGPPSFKVRVIHPPSVVEQVPYELVIDITNTGETPALYASLELDVGADAQLVTCQVNESTGLPFCEPIEGPSVRNLGHLFPGKTARETFTVLPLDTGPISSCMGVADQNITLQVLIGNIGCLVGRFPPQTGVPDGIPTVTVLPSPNTLGVGIDSPVTAFFSEQMNLGTITLGPTGSFRVIDGAGQVVQGQLRFEMINSKTVAIWQVNDGVTNRLAPNTTFSVLLTQDIRDLQGNPLAAVWTSQFRTTSPIVDKDPPALSLSIEPPVNPSWVLPGQIVRIDAYPSDQGTGVDRVELRRLDADTPGALFELIDQKTVFDIMQGPCIFSIDSSKLLPGHTYQFKATAFDKAGNYQDATIAIIVAQNAAPPTIRLPDDPSQPILQGISVNLTPLEVSAGVKTVYYYLNGAANPFATLTLPPFQTSLGTLKLALGNYTVRAVAEDGLGQTGEDTYTFTLVANLNMPVVNFVGSATGAQYITGSSFALRGEASDPVGIQSVNFFLDSTTGNPIATGTTPFTVNTAGLGLGEHTIYMKATNTLGVYNDLIAPSSSLKFSVVELPQGPPPAAPMVLNISYPENGQVTVTGNSVPGARIDVTNSNLNIKISVYANTSGLFSAGVPADTGHVLNLVAYDFTQSQNPSSATSITVPAPPVLDHITVSPTTMSFNAVNAYQDITVTGYYQDNSTANLTSKATFASSNSSVASVNSGGRVVALSHGTAAITASVNSHQDQVSVTVTIITLTSITADPTTVNLVSIGQTQQLNVTGHFSDGHTENLTNSVSYVTGNPNVATVSSSGLITAKGDGNTQISVSKSGVTPVSVPVTVNTAQDTPPSVTILSPVNGTNVERGQSLTVSVKAQDAIGGVTNIYLDVTGQTAYSEMKQVAPASLDVTRQFSFTVSPAAVIGGLITVAAKAEDTGGKTSDLVWITLNVVDKTAPTVVITQPANQTLFNYGQTLNITISASDAVGVTQIRYQTTGALSFSGSQTITPPSQTASASFSFVIPYGVTNPDVKIHAYAKDAGNNEGAAIPVDIIITSADITPPETIVTAVANPGVSTTTTVAYQVTSGLSDLDHVELYFRRNGIGTFNRYTDADHGNPEGKFFPQSGDTGTIVFDSTKMGGDGTYEFYSVGVDKAGNREPAPKDGSGNVVPDKTTTFNAGTVWTIITNPTFIGENDLTFENKNLRVVGTTVTLSGHHQFKNVDLLNAAVLTHPETDLSLEYGLDFEAWTLTIDSTSAINLDGRGYMGGKDYGESGRTVGNVYGSAQGAGGSYGGLGGGYQGAVPNPVYGDLTSPLDLGSGGGAWNNEDGGDGGGRLQLNSVNVVMDGSIRANGGESQGSAAGDGSGGSILILTKTISGSGLVQANGGGNGNGVGAGGGRIAIYYLDLETMNVNEITAQGGLGYYGNGGNGTLFLKQEQKTGGELVLTGQGPAAPWTEVTIPPGYTFDSLTLRKNARVIVNGAIEVTGKLLVTGDSILTHSSANESGLVIDAVVVQVDAGSAIDVTGRGYLGGRTDWEKGWTVGNVYGSDIGAGGSYGGVGGGYQGHLSGRTYGSYWAPDKLGSGGGAWGNTDGGDGGGRVWIRASEAVIVNGAIRANGGESEGSAAGDGSGGSVLIETSRLSGDGLISANGGGSGNGVGGSGGRVAVHCDYVEASHNFNNLYNLTAFGGRGYYDDRRSSAGTIYVKYSNQTNGNLYVDDNVVDGSGNPNGISPESTPLTLIGFGETAGVSSNTLTTDGKVTLLAGDLAGMRFNPDINQPESFVIQSNTANTITVATPNEHGVYFSAVAAAGRIYAGLYRFDNVTFRRGGNLVVGDLLEVTDTMRIAEYGLLTHYESTSSFVNWLDLTVGNLTIDTNSRIDVTGRGYIGGKSYDESGWTVGNVYGSARGAGGSYGGLGGGYQSAVPNPVYGDLTNPLELGSGGGAWGNTDGGDGGGLLLITATNITLDGAIVANGGESEGSAAGDGSGGAVNIVTGTLTGAGMIQANGGGSGNGVGGGGGRIAVIIWNTFSFSDNNVLAFGGAGYYGNAGHGTSYIKKPGQTYGEIMIEGQGQTTPIDTTLISGDITFDHLTIKNSAKVVANGKLTVIGSAFISGGSMLSANGGLSANMVLVTGNSVLTHSSANESGLVIDAVVVQVDAGSAIDVTGRGYIGGKSYDESGWTVGNVYGSDTGAGGSYGGVGGGYQGHLSGRTYGSYWAPDKLGSGGGAWGNTDGGDGGGRVWIRASEAVIVNGAIRANGGESEGSAAGDGSGGSVLIETSRLSGDGLISANGGGSGNGVGGSGGRVAVHCDYVEASHNFNNLYNLTAFGGRGYYDDRRSSAGTIYVKYSNQTNGNLYVDDNVVDGSGNPNGTSPESTPLTLIGFGKTMGVTLDTLTTDGQVALVEGDLIGMRLNPDVNQSESFVIQSNTANTITVTTPNENGVHFSAVAAAGRIYAGLYRFDNVTFRRGGNLVVGDLLEVTDTMRIAEYGLLTHYESTSSFVNWLDLTVGNLTIDTNSRIDVTGRGYIGGKSYDESGWTVGNVYGSARGAGGSYGGLGGGYQSAVPNLVYGDLTNPLELGSGGGAWGNNDGGDGGGLILITAGNITLNGAIIANGNEAQSSAAGAGSGGGINIVTGTLTGDGFIRANGGNQGVGGGGGRVAVDYGNSTFTGQVTVNGGNGNYGSGQNGTIYFQ